MGSPVEIADRVCNWFPELLPNQVRVHSTINSILNSTPFFRKLLANNRNNSKINAGQSRRPLILGKRQHIWSVNQLYLRPFLKHFCSHASSTTTSGNEAAAADSSAGALLPFRIDSSAWSEASANRGDEGERRAADFSFENWKSKVEQFKLLVHLRHREQNLNWSSPSLPISSSNEAFIGKLAFIKFNATASSSSSSATACEPAITECSKNYSAKISMQKASKLNRVDQVMVQKKILKLVRGSSENIAPETSNKSTKEPTNALATLFSENNSSSINNNFNNNNNNNNNNNHNHNHNQISSFNFFNSPGPVQSMSAMMMMMNPESSNNNFSSSSSTHQPSYFYSSAEVNDGETTASGHHYPVVNNHPNSCSYFNLVPHLHHVETHAFLSSNVNSVHQQSTSGGYFYVAGEEPVGNLDIQDFVLGADDLRVIVQQQQRDSTSITAAAAISLPITNSSLFVFK